MKSLKILPYLLAADVLRGLAGLGLLAAAAAAPASPSLGTTLGISIVLWQSNSCEFVRLYVVAVLYWFLVDLLGELQLWCVVLIRGVFFERREIKGVCNTYPYIYRTLC